MATAKRFEDLEIWQNAAKIAIEAYRISNTEQLKHDFGAKDQLRRCAFSISNNIAEGFEYDNKKDFIKFLRYSKGSAGELRNQVYILSKVGVIDLETYEKLYKELISISKQLGGFIKYLRTQEKKPIQ